MESLSAGRSLSLPADAVGSAQLATRVISAYATVREQFGVAIGKFEGIQTRLGRIAGTLYWMNCVRTVTAGAVDAGESPSVISAIAKRWTTEAVRGIANDAMDIAGGFAICRGPRNVLAAIYEGVPIGITVEGANILTRSLIVYGQGALRCHPHALAELRAAKAGAVLAFDTALSGHVNFALRNAARSFVLALTGSAVARAPIDGRPGAVLRQLARTSASFALVGDAAMMTLGGALKRAENLTGHMADALAWMYIAAATVNRHAVAPEAADEDALFDWATREALWQAQQALRGAIDNLPSRAAAALIRLCAFPFGATARPPSDRLTLAAAHALLDGASARLRLTADMYIPANRELGLGRLEHALELAVAAHPVNAKLHDAVRAGILVERPGRIRLDEAVEAHVISEEERDLVDAAEAARDDAIQVDDYSPAAFRDHIAPPLRSPIPAAERRPS